MKRVLVIPLPVPTPLGDVTLHLFPSSTGSLFSCSCILISLVTCLGQQGVAEVIWQVSFVSLSPQKALCMFPHYLGTLSLASWRMRN